MLSNRNQWRREYERTLRSLGTPAVVEKVDGSTISCLVGLNSKPGEELINAWGVNVKVVTVLVTDCPELKKLDRINIEGERHTIDDVRISRINDIDVSHVCIVRGK